MILKNFQTDLIFLKNMKIYYVVKLNFVLLIILHISTIHTYNEQQHYDPRVQTVLKCIQQSEADVEELKLVELPANETSDTKEEKVLCFFKCLAEESRVIINGAIHPENLLFFPLTPPNVDQKLFGTAQECVTTVSKTLVVKTCMDFEKVLTCIRLMFGSIKEDQTFSTDVKDEEIPTEIKSQLDEVNKDKTDIQSGLDEINKNNKTLIK